MRYMLLLSLMCNCLLACAKDVQAAYQSSNATALRRHALQLMDESPLLDTHVDLPQILRALGESYEVACKELTV